MKPFSWKRAANAAEAVQQKRSSSDHFIAGGTNQVDLMKHYIHAPDNLIDINRTGLSNISATAGGCQIGAMARNTEVATNSIILEKFPLVAKAILAGASPQIRNMASVGGNLLQRTRCPYFYHNSAPCNKKKPGSGCSAIGGASRMSAIFGTSPQCIAVHPSDMCVAMAALDAQVHIVRAGNQKAVIPFKDFHRLPGNTPQLDNNLPANALIESVFIPDNAFNKNFHYLKLRDRTSYAFALVSIAAALDLNGSTIREARLAGGGVAHKPWRYTAAENFLKGKQATEENFRQAALLAAQGAKTQSENKFKVPMLRAAVEQALKNCLNA